MLIELCNLGRDADLRYTPDGTAVSNLALAYSVGYGDKKRTQWLDGSLWGKRAESLSPHLTKGTKVLIYADDVELEQYQKNDGASGTKIKCRIVDIKFAGSNGGAAQPAANKPQQQQQQQQQGEGYNDFDDPIPF